MLYFFGYEKTIGDKWSPVLYHGEKPKVKDGYRISSNGSVCPTTAFVEIREDHEPSFGYLMSKYPPPQREVTMVRPVEGYKTKDGKFFETEDEAIIHETVFELTDKFREYVEGTDFATVPPEIQDELVLKGLQFITANSSTLRRYLDVVDRKSEEGSLHNVPPPSIPDDGSTPEGTS